MREKGKYKRYDPLEAWSQVEKQLDKMTPDERAQTLVRAGIVTEKMNLRKPYREAFKAASA